MGRHRRKPTPHYLVNIGLSILVIAIFSLTGFRVASQTNAATANPYGNADYCALENNATVIYGWAADPNSTSLTQPSVTLNVGGKSVTVMTNRAGYRDAQVNAWINKNRSGDPKPGTYGFRAVIQGLNKGTRNTITGTALNEGAGSSVILGIQSSGSIDGDTSKSFFGGNVIPEACLASAAGTGQTTPPATTTNPPAPGAITSTPNPPRVEGSVTQNVSNTVDAAVTSGTLAAEIRVTSGGASAIMVRYGTTAASLDQNTNYTPITGGETVIKLTSLKAATTYYYQIARADPRGIQTASPTGKFDTLGFTINMHFVDNTNQGIAGIPATMPIQNKKKTSDNEGNLSFIGVPDGTHKVNYTYKDQRYTHMVTANSSVVTPDEASSPTVLSIDSTVNVEAAIGKQPSSSGGDGMAGTLIAVVLGLIALVMVYLAIQRRRKLGPMAPYFDEDSEYMDPAPPLPEYQAQASYQQLPPQQPEQPVSYSVPRPSRAPHTGESLKDMVIRSMHEEAHRRAQQNKNDPQ